MFEIFSVPTKYSFFSANQTRHSIKSSIGRLEGVLVGAKGTVASTITLYDAYQNTATALTPYTGTATAGSATTLTDSGRSWGVNSLAGLTLSITAGTGSGQSGTIASNTATTVTLTSALATPLDATSVYDVNSAAIVPVSGAGWPVGKFVGKTLVIVAGTGSGQNATIVSNTSEVIKVASDWSTPPDATSVFWIADSATPTIGVVDSLNLSGPFPFMCDFNNGLVVTSTGTVAPSFTVLYK